MITASKLVIVAQGGSPEIGLPEQAPIGSCIAVRVKGIDAVMLRGDKDHVVSPLPWKDKIGDVKRLGINITVHRVSHQASEVRHVDVGQGEKHFIGIGPLARVVIVIGQNIESSRIGRRQNGQDRGGTVGDTQGARGGQSVIPRLSGLNGGQGQAAGSGVGDVAAVVPRNHQSAADELAANGRRHQHREHHRHQRVEVADLHPRLDPVHNQPHANRNRDHRRNQEVLPDALG